MWNFLLLNLDSTETPHLWAAPVRDRSEMRTVAPRGHDSTVVHCGVEKEFLQGAHITHRPPEMYPKNPSLGSGDTVMGMPSGQGRAWQESLVCTVRRTWSTCSSLGHGLCLLKWLFTSDRAAPPHPPRASKCSWPRPSVSRPPQSCQRVQGHCPASACWVCHRAAVI